MVVGVALDALTGQLITAVDALKDTIRDSIAFADNAQKASLALGQTYENTRVTLGGTMEGLRGDITQRFSAAIAGMEAGLQGNTAGIARLINQQQLTGTAYQQTAKAFARLEAGLNLSRDDTNVLSESLIETGRAYGVSTDKLVEAIDALKATFPAQALAGMGSEVMQAVTLLQGELGPQVAQPLQNVMKMVMDTSLEGYEKLVKLGIGDLREQIANSDMDARGLRDVLKQALSTADKSIRDMTTGSNNFFAMIGVAEETFGKGILDITTVVQNFGRRTEEEANAAFDFAMSLDTLRSEAITPFKEAFVIAYPAILEGVNVISGVLNILGTRFKAFAETLAPEGSVRNAMKGFSLAVIDFTSTTVEFFSQAFFDITKDGGIIDQVTAGLLRLGAVADDIAGMSFWDGIEENMAEQRAEEKRAQATALENAVKNAQKDRDTTKDPIVLQLASVRESIEKSGVFQRQTNSELEEAKERLASIDRKTPEREVDGTNEFLKQTARSLSTDMQRLLGFGGDDTAKSMLEELQEIKANTFATATAPTGGGQMVPIDSDL